MKKFFIAAAAVISVLSAGAQSKVFFTKKITPEALVRIYNALGRKAHGKVAVKISTGEPGGHNFLDPKLISGLVKEVDGTIVECNTAYKGKRFTSEESLQAAKDHGFCDIAQVDIMDWDGSDTIPVKDTKHLKYNIVGKNLSNYDFLINLAHFKGHAMGGFGGVLKNQSIGVASADGKALIHTAGLYSDARNAFKTPKNGQDGFLEAMAGAAQSVHEYFKDKKGIVYINVMNNLSVDCDCDGHPHAPEMKDMGILASLDPVALDKACLDLVFNHTPTEGDNNQALVERINSRHGTHIVDYAEQIGLGTKNYEIVKLKSKNENNDAPKGVKKITIKGPIKAAEAGSGSNDNLIILDGQNKTK